LVLAAGATGACKQNDDRDGATQLYAKVNEGAGYRAWRRAPGFPQRKASFTAHANAVEIFVSPEVAAALDGPAPVTSWPIGSIVVKEGFRGDERALVAIMEKRADGWFWVETDGDGEPLFSGKPAVCIECHDNRAGSGDWIYSFDLPR
jgi:hypothetical protein